MEARRWKQKEEALKEEEGYMYIIMKVPILLQPVEIDVEQKISVLFT